MFLMGIDCATKANKTGLAFGRLDGGKFAVCSAKRGKGGKWEKGIDPLVNKWIERGKMEHRKVLLALDAPLGWPQPLGDALVSHEAGEPLSKSADPDLMFMRETDRRIHRNIGKKPFSVGADKIARTAHAALSFLERLQIPLAWGPANLAPVSAIEAYPTVTLSEHGFLPDTTYKNAGGRKNRENIIGDLKTKMKLCGDTEKQMLNSDDVLDAVVCVLAAADFAKGDAAPPENMKLAKKEGWIWVRKP